MGGGGKRRDGSKKQERFDKPTCTWSYVGRARTSVPTTDTGYQRLTLRVDIALAVVGRDQVVEKC
jgi:hypothetical protein